ncbi:MAG: DUF2182 domain-containing protein [Euryarchaeota archaeon]|nr:DUF2182 domain-containing protein [Euryarchaeota archaeon]
MVSREQALLLGGIGGLSLLGWLVLLHPPVPAMGEPTPAGAVLFVALWTVMMVAMMLPSAYPMVATFARHSRAQKGGGRRGAMAGFVLGYLLAWALFGGAALLLDLGVHPLLSSVGPWGPGVLIAAGGLYQFTPLKNACLGKCRNPLGFFMEFWRGGRFGPLRMGMRHGVFCLGCCAALMVLLVAVGAMALPWVAALALAIAAEKLLPRGVWAARATGIVLVALGGLVAAGLLALAPPAEMAMGG